MKYCVIFIRSIKCKAVRSSNRRNNKEVRTPEAVTIRALPSTLMQIGFWTILWVYFLPWCQVKCWGDCSCNLARPRNSCL